LLVAFGAVLWLMMKRPNWGVALTVSLVAAALFVTLVGTLIGLAQATGAAEPHSEAPAPTVTVVAPSPSAARWPRFGTLC
jgi:hypothetical protein